MSHMQTFDIAPWKEIIQIVHSQPEGDVPLAATLTTSDGGSIHVELHGQGRIAFVPWTSGLKEEFQQTYENAIEIQSGSGHDVEVLKFLAAFSAFQKEQIDAEHMAHMELAG